MKRLLPLLALLAVTVAGCSLGQPKQASDVADVSATLNADIGSNQGGEVKYWFRYGTTTEYGTVTPDRTVQFPAGHDTSGDMIAVSEPITGLEPNTTYHFQVCTSPGVEPGSRGCTPQDRTFKTGSLSDNVEGSGTLEWSHAPPGSITTFDVEASSGGGGEDASGTFSFSNSATDTFPAQSFNGTVSCLNIGGGAGLATLGGVITGSTFSGIFQVGERLRFTVKDGEQIAGDDAFSDLYVASGPGDCATVLTNHDLLSGDILVHNDTLTP